MEPYRITTEDGKKVGGMLKGILAGEIPLEGFLDRLYDFKDKEAFERLTEAEFWFASEITDAFEFYEPNPDIRGTAEEFYGEDELMSQLKGILEAAMIENV